MCGWGAILRCAVQASHCRGFFKRITGSRVRASAVAVRGLSCSTASGIFLDQESNPCLLHWRVDALPQGRAPEKPCNSLLWGASVPRVTSPQSPLTPAPAAADRVCVGLTGLEPRVSPPARTLHLELVFAQKPLGSCMIHSALTASHLKCYLHIFSPSAVSDAAGVCSSHAPRTAVVAHSQWQHSATGGRGNWEKADDSG